MKMEEFKEKRGLVYIKTVNSCPRVWIDIQKIKDYLVANNFYITDNAEAAGNILVFFCSFNNSAENEALEILKELKSRGKDLSLFILEGIAATSKEKLVKLGFDPNKIIARWEYEKLDAFFGIDIKFSKIKDSNLTSRFPKDLFVVQVCRGCDSNCSYCGDKIIVGNLRSKPLDECLSEFKKGLSLGYKKIHLLGDDVGAYGLDIGSSIFELLKNIAGLGGHFTLSIEEVNIKYLIKNIRAFEEALRSVKIESLLCGFQSGNDRILKLMNRGYSKKEMLALFNILSRHRVKVAFHAIAGFPTETFGEFKETLSIIERVDFSWGIIFKYQDREYTPSSDIFPKINEEEETGRLKYAARRLSNRYHCALGAAGGSDLKDSERDSDRLNLWRINRDNMKKLKNIFRKIPYLVQINRQRLKVQNAINQQWSRLLRLIFNRISFDPTNIFLQFSPNSSGPYKNRAALTVKTINNIFPSLASLLQSTGRSAVLPVDIMDFLSDTESRQSSLTIKELFDRYGSDKANPHNYHWLYGSILKNRQAISSVLEIGIGTDNTEVASHMGAQGSPGASLRAFRDFLPHAEIYGADIDRRVLFTEDRIKTFFVDQTDLASFKNLNTFLLGELDLIIDDGLHSPDANINTLNFALTKVKPGGWVVIEDIRSEAMPVWEVVSCILPEQFECHLLEADRGLVFAVQRKC